jgi:hypothetical protein
VAGPRPLYDYIDFGGRSFAVDREISISTVFNDRAQSLIVHAGTWGLRRRKLRQRLSVLRPGRYASLGTFRALKLAAPRRQGRQRGAGGVAAQQVLYWGRTSQDARSIGNYM